MNHMKPEDAYRINARRELGTLRIPEEKETELIDLNLQLYRGAIPNARKTVLFHKIKEAREKGLHGEEAYKKLYGDLELSEKARKAQERQIQADLDRIY